MGASNNSIGRCEEWHTALDSQFGNGKGQKASWQQRTEERREVLSDKLVWSHDVPVVPLHDDGTSSYDACLVCVALTALPPNGHTIAHNKGVLNHPRASKG